MRQKLTADRAEMILVFRRYFSRAAVAREYGVHPDTIRNVENGTSFAREPSRRKDRKLTDDEVRRVHAWGSQGFKEAKIAGLLDNKVSRSTVRQILAGKSYKEVV